MIYQGKAKYPVHEVVLHCSATRPEWWSSKPTKAKVSEIRRWHVENNGWRDIGYHYVVDRNGALAEGRPETEVGAHARGHNQGTIGICLMGGHGSSADDDFSAHFTEQQRRAVWKLLRDIASRTDLQKVTGHNRYAAKACPGFVTAIEFPWPPPEEQPSGDSSGFLSAVKAILHSLLALLRKDRK